MVDSGERLRDSPPKGLKLSGRRTEGFFNECTEVWFPVILSLEVTRDGA